MDDKKEELYKMVVGCQEIADALTNAVLNLDQQIEFLSALLNYLCINILNIPSNVYADTAASLVQNLIEQRKKNDKPYNVLASSFPQQLHTTKKEED